MNRENKTKIVIIGAGYAGMMATLRLSGKTRGQNVTITLINGVDVFIQRPLLHQVATNQDVPQKPIAEMLCGHAVHFVQGWVTALDPQQRLITVKTPEGLEQVGYDYLVYALGSVVDRESVPGVASHAYVLDPAGERGTVALRQKLQAIGNTTQRVVVVGSGPTGIEAATEISSFYPNLRVNLVTNGVFGAFKNKRVEQHLRQAFHAQGLQIYEQSPVREVKADEIVLSTGDTIHYDVLLWAGGFRTLPLARQAGLAVNPQRGQILVDPFLRSISHSDIYAVGDACDPVEDPGVKMRMSLLVAITSGAQAADNLVAQIKNQAQQPLSFGYYGQAISLGPNDAVGFGTTLDDQPFPLIFRGRLAVRMRAFFVWLLLYTLELERRMPGFYFWIGKGRYAAAKRRQVKQSESEVLA